MGTGTVDDIGLADASAEALGRGIVGEDGAGARTLQPAITAMTTIDMAVDW